jgi:uncharacterized protein with von Willebrand factor type A (vWA) domain
LSFLNRNTSTNPMSHDDLLRMLDLEGTVASPANEPLNITPADEHARPAATSPTVLKLDEWGLRRGDDLLAESERLRECLADVGRPELQGQAVADFHAAAFELDPQLNEGCSDSLRWEFLKQLMETPEYHELRASTVGNTVASEIAATAFASQYAELRKDREPDEKQEPRDKRHGDDSLDAEMAVMRHVAKAVSEASREVDEAREAAAAVGMGPGAPGSNDPQAIAALYKRVRCDPTLKRICELAGRYRRVAQSRQRQKDTHGLDDVVGVVMDADLGRLLPHELAKLALPEFEDDTLRRLVERQTQCREYRAMEPVAKGPILVSVDESGSMCGDKVHTAKALALALAWIARQQRRWCGLVAYSGGSGERLLPLPPGRWNEVGVLDWLAEFIGGGSTLDVPVQELPDYYQRLSAPVGKTDVILITDAICCIPKKLQQAFLAWKQKVQARVISLIVASEPGDLAGISDEVHKVPSLAVTEAAVERVLSI